MCNILKTKTLTYNLRSQTEFVRDCVDTRRYGPNSLSYSPPKIWDMIPSEIKSINSLQKFKTEGARKTALVIFIGHTYRVYDLLIWFKLLICFCKL